MDNRLQTYREVNVKTMNRGKIVVMLFSGAVTFLTKAKLYAEKEDFYNKGLFINKAQNIIDELNYSLDMERGQDIAKNLRSVYVFLGRYLSDANKSNDPDMLDRAISIIETLKSAFEEVVDNPQYADAQAVNRKEMAQHAIRRFV
ncbi:MAG: flagellar export chaperone FliS [Candidatus Cloacimonetes bacterium]|nr:flagellar export chaperone FliS [Candidatus Cloacimonadota bacterium]